MQSLQQQIYQRLKESLHQGRFEPGEKLKIRQLAAQWQVSAMPVRAALLTLVAEGALEGQQQRSVRVPVLTASRYKEILAVRLTLEGEAAERGTTRINAQQKAQLTALVEQMKLASASADASAYLQANSNFHLVLYSACGNNVLVHLIESLWMQTGPLFRCFFHQPDISLPLNDFHEDVLDGLDKGDPYRVRAAIEADLKYFGQFLLEHLDQQSEKPAL